ncbi:nucleotidyltransferase family protein [bacterium]|nr:nucleotidyltransferase family protein [bacterium]
MKRIEEIKKIINQHRQELEERFKVKSIAIFGSYVREEQSPQSDIDIIVEFKEPVGFLFIHLADFLEEILETKVDLLTPEAIKPNRRKYIMEELVYV